MENMVNYTQKFFRCASDQLGFRIDKKMDSDDSSFLFEETI